MRRNVWMLSWSLLENMGFDARGSCGEFSMLWAASVMLLGSFLLWMRKIPAVSLRVRLFFAGWTDLGFWKRARTSLIMSLHWLWRTSLRGVFKPKCSKLVWPSPSTTPGFLSGKGTSGIYLLLMSTKCALVFVLMDNQGVLSCYWLCFILFMSSREVVVVLLLTIYTTNITWLLTAPKFSLSQIVLNVYELKHVLWPNTFGAMS